MVASLGSGLVGRVLITGAAGMLGRKLAARLADVDEVLLHDIVEPSAPARAAYKWRGLASDLSALGEAEKLLAARPQLVFHLAAIVSGEAEADFDKGYRVNLDGTRRLFEAIRAIGGGYKPRVVFASSIAVFGAPFPEAIGDEFLCAPLTSYGTQKAIDELLLADYSRRGFFDGVGIRLPTICVRPGKPNRAASGFFSGIIREPLAGQEAVLPVTKTVRHWFASPRAGVGFLLHAARDGTIPVRGGTSWRPCLHVRDAARAARAWLELDRPSPAGTLLNVGEGNYQKRHLAQVAAGAFPSVKIQIDDVAGDRDYCVDFSNSRRLFGSYAEAGPQLAATELSRAFLGGLLQPEPDASAR